MACLGNVLRFRLAMVVSIIPFLGNQGTKPAYAEAAQASEVRLTNPRGVFVDSNGNILVANRGGNSVVLFHNLPAHNYDKTDWPFSLVPFGVIESSKGPTLESPCDVAVDSKGRIVVADTGNDIVKIFPAPYDSRSRPEVIRRFSSPEGVAIDERDNIIVFDTGNGKVRILSPEGKLRATIPTGSPAAKKGPRPFLKAPIAGCCLGKGYLAVADRAGGQAAYSLWRYDPVSPSSESCQFVGYGPPIEETFNAYVRDVAYDRERGVLAYIASNFPLRNTAFLYFQAVAPNDPRTLVPRPQDSLPWLRVPLVGWLKDPTGLAFSPEGNLYITDAASHSLQKISRESFSILNAPVRVDAQRSRATLKYFSSERAPTLLQYGELPGHVRGSGSSELLRSYADPEEVFA
ncbi:hypothetical protein HQ563_14310, partial [bacterium]|nr:hypothetical protein [bacterium]